MMMTCNQTCGGIIVRYGIMFYASIARAVPKLECKILENTEMAVFEVFSI